MSKPDDERIWAGIRPGIETWWQRYAHHQTREYIRADLHDAEVEALRKENERLRLALRIIAGQEQCLDNLMGHADIARAALQGETG